MEKKSPRVLIAGAGIGGLTAALSLLKKGIDCEVYEQAPELKEIGAGLWVSPNGWRVLFALGLEQELRSINLLAEDRVVRLWDSGDTWSVYNRQNPDNVPHTLFMLLRAELHRILAEAVLKIKPDAVHLNCKADSFEQDDQGVTLKFTDGRSVRGDALIGADGLHSKVRQTAFGPAPGRFMGAVAWRGLVPIERLPEHHRAPIASTWIGPTAHVTSYPVKKANGEMFMSFSGQADTNVWQAESWSQTGSIEECLEDFKGWHADIVDLVRNAETLFKWGMFVREPLAHWSKDRVTLLGDACHTMVPYLGQGVNMAIEDGHVLARCIEANPDNLAQALVKYENARRDRGNLTVARSASMSAVFHNAALEKSETAMPYINENWSPAKVKERYDWLFNYDATTVAI